MDFSKVVSMKISFGEAGEMIFSVAFCLFFTGSANSVHINVAYDMIKSALGYYNSHSVLLIFNENYSSSDLFKLVILQKRLSSGNNLYYSSIITPSGLSEAFETYRHSLRETVVIWNPNEKFPHVLQEVSNEIDITSHKWFVATHNLTPEAFKHITIPLYSEFTIARGNPWSGYDLEEIYDVIPGMRLSNPLGRWSLNSQEFQLQASTYMFERRKDFQGATIKVASPIEGFEEDCNLFSILLKTTTLIVCIHQKVWFELEKKLNLSTNTQVIPDLNEDAIQNGDFDLTFRSVLITPHVMKTRDFSWPVFTNRIRVVTSYIRQTFKWDTFISPFRQEMWIMIFIWIILWDLILVCFQFIKEIGKSNNSFLHVYNDFSFMTMFSFFGQGIFYPSKSFSIRIIVLLMFIVPAVLFRGYSAVLMSFLTVQLDKKPFRNLEEFSHDKEYKIGWDKAFRLEDVLDLKSCSLNAELLEKLLQARNDLATSDTEGLERMCNEKYTYLTINSVLLAHKVECKYYVFDQHFMKLSIGMELKKGSWYKYYLDRYIRSMKYSRITWKLLSEFAWGFVYKQFYETFDENEPIKIENIILPFVVLLLGVIASVIILFLEIILFWLKSKQIHKSDIRPDLQVIQDTTS